MVRLGSADTEVVLLVASALGATIDFAMPFDEEDELVVEFELVVDVIEHVDETAFCIRFK